MQSAASTLATAGYTRVEGFAQDAVTGLHRESKSIRGTSWQAIFNQRLTLDGSSRRDTKRGREAVYAMLEGATASTTVGESVYNLPCLVTLGRTVAQWMSDLLGVPWRLNIAGYIRTRVADAQHLHRDLPESSRGGAYTVFVGVHDTGGQPTVIVPRNASRRCEHILPGDLLCIDSCLPHAGGGCGTGGGRTVAFFSLVPQSAPDVSYTRTYPVVWGETRGARDLCVEK